MAASSNAAAIAEDVSIAGTVVVVLLLLAQLPAMWTVVTKTRSVAHLSVGPTVAQMANFVSWVVYGLVGKVVAVLRVNAIGVAFGLGYLAVFLAYARGPHWWSLVRLIIAAVVIFGTVFAGIIIPGSLTTDEKVKALGFVALICNVAMFAGPLTQLVCGGVVCGWAAVPAGGRLTCGRRWQCHRQVQRRPAAAGPPCRFPRHQPHHRHCAPAPR